MKMGAEYGTGIKHGNTIEAARTKCCEYMTENGKICYTYDNSYI